MVEEPNSSSKNGIKVKFFSITTGYLGIWVSIGMKMWANEKVEKVIYSAIGNTNF